MYGGSSVRQRWGSDNRALVFHPGLDPQAWIKGSQSRGRNYEDRNHEDRNREDRNREDPWRSCRGTVRLLSRSPSLAKLPPWHIGKKSVHKDGKPSKISSPPKLTESSYNGRIPIAIGGSCET